MFFFLAAVLILVKVIRDQNKEIVLNEIAGQTMGTIPYHIKYKTKGERDYKPSIDSLLVAFNQSLSTYLPASEISRFNRADTLVFESSLFYPVLSKSRHVYEATGGAFDPTIGPLVNAWGFGPDT
ncbi:MAG: FAD:protein FMN transferase, partial [Cyclobacteriaceae bacterium]|nr:FAD:protein FMN transferase [Cyclobacteriaceae bacterium]